MEKQININLNSFKVFVHPVDYKNIKAFAEVEFLDSEGNLVIKVKGFTVKLKEFNGKSTLSVDFPAYPSKGKFKNSFYVAVRAIWQLIVDEILSELAQANGGLTPDDYKNNEDIDPDDIPF